MSGTEYRANVKDLKLSMNLKWPTADNYRQQMASLKADRVRTVRRRNHPPAPTADTDGI
jgi:hypothetical protein